MGLKSAELKGRTSSGGEAYRLKILQYLFLAGFLILGLRLWSLQVIDHQLYDKKAESNRLKTIPIPAARGLIIDRDGRVLVQNRPTLSIVLSREELQTRGKKVMQVVGDLIAHGVKIDLEFVKSRIRIMRRLPLYYPLVVKADADPADVAWVRAHQLEFPELDVVERPQRAYPYGKWMAHVVGYVGEVTQQQLSQPEYQDEYQAGDEVGRAGVEKVYDRFLRGRDGIRRVVVDSRGREITQIEQIDPRPGSDVRLTIDLDLQRVAEEQLGDRTGVVIALDPRNGEVLALVSHPAFDPNLFSRQIMTPAGRQAYQRLIHDPLRPLYDRAIQGIYPTGSTWKILVATAGLEEGVITMRDSHLQCGGGLQVGRRFVRCMGQHGTPDVHRALVVSCDGYFYRLGLKLGIDRMHSWVKRMGLGQRTGIDLPNERFGIIPGRKIKAKLNPRDPIWRDHDTVLAAVGQGAVAVTPLQLLRAVAGISLGGEFHTPHVLLSAGPIRHQISYQGDEVVRIPLREETRQIIRYGLWGAVNEQGTGIRARLVGFDVSGKTGTAQVVASRKASGALRDHAWFVAFAPRDDPEIAVVVLVEHAGFGGTHSAPIARAVFEAYRNKHYGEPQQVEVQVAGRERLNSSAPIVHQGAPAATSTHSPGSKPEPVRGEPGETSMTDPSSSESDVGAGESDPPGSGSGLRGGSHRIRGESTDGSEKPVTHGPTGATSALALW